MSKPNEPFYLRKRAKQVKPMPVVYDERQRAVIDALTAQGYKLRALDPNYDGDFRVVGDQITLNIDVAEKLLGL